MANLPTVGGSNNTWGTELNAYLQVEHNTDGTHNAAKVLMMAGNQTASGNKVFNGGITTEISNTFTLYKALTRSWIFTFTSTDTAVGGVNTMALTTDGVGSALKLYFPDTAGGMRLWLWEPGRAVPNLPHTGIPPALAVWGDLLIGDIICIESNPMTLFMRQNTGLPSTATTQFFSARAINNDTDGGAGITMAPDDGVGAESGKLRLIAYGKGGTGEYNSIVLSTRSGVGTLADRVLINLGMRVGAPTGGDKGMGTINISADIYKNNAAYTNPDYVLEKWATGKIEKYINNEGAKTYDGIMSIDEVRNYAQLHHRLPRIDDKPKGMFDRTDILLEKIEELYIYIFQLKDEIEKLKGKND